MPGHTYPLYLKGDIGPYGDEIVTEREVVISSFDGSARYVLRNCKALRGPEDLVVTPGTGEDRFLADQNAYGEMFTGILKYLKSGKAEKLVLSRIKKAATSRTAVQIFQDLNTLYGATYNYILSSELTGTWIGASPELLLNVNAGKLNTASIAGTRPVAEPFEWTDKEIREQALVTEYIASRFQENQVEDLQISERYNLKAGPVEHLKTDISARKSAQTDISKLLAALHPTPATCGVPGAEAMKLILQTERHQRRLYTGYIGIRNRDTQTYFVNLRCMELFTDYALLYLGGGILKGSDREKEWDETEKKALTLLRVL